MTKPFRVDILVCTFRRPDVVRTLLSVAALKVPDAVTVKIIVADNDDTPSGKTHIDRVTPDLPFGVQYIHAPARNISIARNACLDASKADWVALLDDDEYVGVDWLVNLLATAQSTHADAVFGPVLADYDDETPHWIKARDYHSSRPERRAGVVETGISGNALLRWRDAQWQTERFDVGRGRSGGEDTEFFFRLRRAGATYEICDAAPARESVPADRLSLRWLSRRKYRMGQSYAVSTNTRAGRIMLGARAIAKAAVSFGVAGVNFPSQERRNFWWLRGIFHLGVCAGCLLLSQSEHYGFAASSSDS